MPTTHDQTADVAQRVISRLGGTVTVSKIVGRTPGAISKWQAPRSRGGTGGLIPARYYAPLLAYARQHGIDLTPAELIGGAP